MRKTIMMLAVLLLAMATKGESKVLMLSWDRKAKVVKHYTEGSDPFVMVN